MKTQGKGSLIRKIHAFWMPGIALALCIALQFMQAGPSQAAPSALMKSGGEYELDYGKLVPASATFLAKLNVGRILSISGAVDLIMGKLKADQQKKVNEFVQKTGVDLSKDIHYFFAFGGEDPATTSGLFLGAKLKEEQLADFVAIQTGQQKLSVKDCMGFKVRSRKKDDPVAFAFLSGDLSIVAPSQVIEKVIDLKVGWDSENLERGDKELVRVAGQGNDEMFLWAAAVVPESVRKSSEKYHANLKKVRSLFLSVTFDGALKLSMTAWVDDPASVPALASFLEKGAADAGKSDFFGNILNLSSTLKVTRAKDSVQAEIYCGLDTLAKLMESLKDGIMAFSSQTGEKKGGRSTGGR